MFRKILSVTLCITLFFALSLTAIAESDVPLFDQINGTEEQNTSSETTESGNLMEDGLFESMKDGEYRVFGSDVTRSEVQRIRFLNSLETMGTDAWDVSAGGDGSVLAEFASGILKIAANGNVKAPASCAYLFGLYRNLKSVTGTEYFDTSEVTDMTGMFSGCSSLRTIDLNAWDVSKVTSMASMFEGCSELRKVSASNWDTSSLTNSTGIFSECSQLGFDTIEGLNTEKYEAMEAEAEKTYTPLKPGDNSSAVQELQNRLNKAGYNCGKADGIYGSQTGSAVHAYKTDHNIYDGGKHTAGECVASALMQASLCAAADETSETADTEDTEISSEPVKETGITLTIPDTCKIESKELSDNKVRLSLQLHNASSDHSVIAYTLAIYGTSVWTAESAASPVYYTVMQTIAPGKTEKSDSVIISADGRIANLYIGVQSVTYDDGSSVIADDISYRSFNAISWASDD